MAELTLDIAGDVVAACRKSADEIVAAFGRALDGPIAELTVGEASTHDPAQPPEGFDSAGLAIVLTVGDTGAIAFLPESTGLLPDWYAQPDATGAAKLRTLAQELGVLAMPATHVSERGHAFRVESLKEALERARAAADAVHVPLVLKHGEKQGQLSLIWPLTEPDALLPESTEDTVGSEMGAAATDLPKHLRSFLKVEVPVSVLLAQQKQSVQEILGLVPGAIIKFDKNCDELLDLVVGDQPIAAGEVVKVGDKFGLRIRHMTMPQEQFVAVKWAAAS